MNLVRPGTLFIYKTRVYEVLEVGTSIERRLVLEHRKRAPADPLPDAERLEEGTVIYLNELEAWPNTIVSARITDIIDENRYVRAYYYLTGIVERKAS